MTSEVLIMRQSGIIFAADKAVTSPNNKSYTTSRKIFNLDTEFPASMMINGYVDFEGVFIGDLIGEFKKKNDFKEIGDIEEIKNEFIKFLERNTSHTSKEEYLSIKLDLFKCELGNQIADYGFEEAVNYPKQDIPDYIKNRSSFDVEFHNLIPDGFDKARWNLEIWRIFSDWLRYEGTGIIIAGYNIDSYYPTFFEINIHCNDNGKIIYEELDCRINLEEAFIKVFAINEEAYAFLTGVGDKFEYRIREIINKSNNTFKIDFEKRLEDFDLDYNTKREIIDAHSKLIDNNYKTINHYIERYEIQSLQDTSESLEYLPNELLCDLADYLIQITGLKQKISSELETVSIETDVGLLTKANNFKWIKQDINRIRY